jgi:hypothetical protein
MSLREILGKANLRAIVILGSVLTLWTMILYVLFKASPEIKISGTINIDVLIGAFISIISTVMGYLFGVEKK